MYCGTQIEQHSYVRFKSTYFRPGFITENALNAVRVCLFASFHENLPIAI